MNVCDRLTQLLFYSVVGTSSTVKNIYGLKKKILDFFINSEIKLHTTNILQVYVF